MTETTYRFAPHPAGGFILGLRVPQLCGLIAGGLGALGALRSGGLGALALAIAIIAVAAATVLIPVRGQTLEPDLRSWWAFGGWFRLVGPVLAGVGVFSGAESVGTRYVGYAL